MFGMLMLDFYSIDSYSCLSPLLRRPIFVTTLPRVRRVRTKLCEWLSLERKSISLISRAAYTFSRTPIRVYEQFHYRKECPTPISKLNSTTVSVKSVSALLTVILNTEHKSRLRHTNDSDSYLRKMHFFLSRRSRVLIHSVNLVLRFPNETAEPFLSLASSWFPWQRNLMFP